MNKVILFLMFTYFTCLNIFGCAYGETISAMKIIDSLRSDNFEIVDKTIKYLGIKQGISGGFKKFQVLQPWTGESKNLFVLALSWEPPDGYILLLNSSGKVLSKVRTGYIKSINLREMERLEATDVIIVDARVGHGSGFREDKFQIFLIKKEGLLKIWEEISYLSDIYMQNKTIDGNIGFELNPDNITYDLKYSYRVEKYSYNPKTTEWSIAKTDNYSKTYILKKDKFILNPTSAVQKTKNR